jgi:hypothetical protein
VISKHYTLTLALSLKGEGINGWTRGNDFVVKLKLALFKQMSLYRSFTLFFSFSFAYKN